MKKNNCACSSSQSEAERLRDDMHRFNLVLSEASTLRESKLSKYGDCYKDFGILGVAIKCNDKCARIRRLSQHPDIDAGAETLRDSAIDLLNYAAMLVMVIDEAMSDEHD